MEDCLHGEDRPPSEGRSPSPIDRMTDTCKSITCPIRRMQAVDMKPSRHGSDDKSAHCAAHSMLGSSLTNTCENGICGSKRVSCYAGHQEVSMCHSRDEPGALQIII